MVRMYIRYTRRTTQKYQEFWVFIYPLECLKSRKTLGTVDRVILCSIQLGFFRLAQARYEPRLTKLDVRESSFFEL